MEKWKKDVKLYPIGEEEKETEKKSVTVEAHPESSKLEILHACLIQKAIDFVNWIFKNKYSKGDATFQKDMWFDDKGEGIAESTQELMKQYLQQLKDQP